MAQSLVGYKLLDPDGNAIQQWGGEWGSFPSVPDVITLPNGNRSHGVSVGETFAGGYKLVAWMMDAPAPSPQSVYAAAIAAGIDITSTSTPTLSATYSVDPNTVGININTIINGINAGLGLPGGGSTFAYFDKTGVPHMFTQAQFLALAKAIMNYVYALDLFLWGAGPQPSAEVTIA